MRCVMPGIKRGEIYDANLLMDGSVQGGRRPVIIIQNDVGNKNSPNVSVIPITKRNKARYMPTHVMIKADPDNGLARNSVAMAESTITIPKERLIARVGQLRNDDMVRIQNAIKIQFGLV